jgi:hypothetical protein
MVSPMLTKRLTTTLAALAVAVLLAAGCGGGSGDGGGDDDVASLSDDDSSEQAQADEADAEEELYDWVECMRDEGVDLPDPTRDADGNLVLSGPGIVIGGGEGGSGTFSNEDEPEGEEPPIDREDMEAATEVCGPPPALGAGDISEEDRQAQQEAALEFAECMRDEGIDDFPDPDFSNEGPGGEAQTNENEAEPGEDGGGERILVGPFGEIDMDDPQVAAAFEACQDVLGGPERGGPGGPSAGEGADT